MVAFIFGIRVIKFDKAKYAAVAASDWLENTLEFEYKFSFVIDRNVNTQIASINLKCNNQYGNIWYLYMTLCKQENVTNVIWHIKGLYSSMSTYKKSLQTDYVYDYIPYYMTTYDTIWQHVLNHHKASRRRRKQFKWITNIPILLNIWQPLTLYGSIWTCKASFNQENIANAIQLMTIYDNYWHNMTAYDCILLF